MFETFLANPLRQSLGRLWGIRVWAGREKGVDGRWDAGSLYPASWGELDVCISLLEPSGSTVFFESSVGRQMFLTFLAHPLRQSLGRLWGISNALLEMKCF